MVCIFQPSFPDSKTLNKKERKVKRLAVAGNRTQDTWLVQPVLCHWATTTSWEALALMILCIYVLHRWDWNASVALPGSHSVCAIRTMLGIDQKKIVVFLCWPFHFPLFSPKFSLFQPEAGVLSISLQLTSIQSYGLRFKIIHIFSATNTKSLYVRLPHKASQYGDYIVNCHCSNRKHLNMVTI